MLLNLIRLKSIHRVCGRRPLEQQKKSLLNSQKQLVTDNLPNRAPWWLLGDQLLDNDAKIRINYKNYSTSLIARKRDLISKSKVF